MVRVFLLAIAFCAGQCVAAETSARTYAVLSLVGDRLMVAAPQVDARQPSSRDAFIDLPGGVLDSAAAIAIQDAMHEADPDSTTVLLRARGPEFFKMQADVLYQVGGSLDLYRLLRPRLGDLPATHLVLVEKIQQAPTRMFSAVTCRSGWNACSGRLEGIGVYLGRGAETRDSEGNVVEGFLAPFAYVRLALFDLRKGELLAEEVVTKSRIFPSPPDKDPSETLTQEEKLVQMREVLISGVRAAIPRLIQQR